MEKLPPIAFWGICQMESGANDLMFDLWFLMPFAGHNSMFDPLKFLVHLTCLSLTNRSKQASLVLPLSLSSLTLMQKLSLSQALDYDAGFELDTIMLVSETIFTPICHWTRLQRVRLEGCLYKLPMQIAALTSLCHLEVIAVIDSSAFMEDEDDVYPRRLEWDEFFDVLQAIPSLQSIAVKSCQDFELASVTAIGPLITKLELCNGLLHTVPPAIAGLTGLVHLNLHGNPISGLPMGPYLSHLQYLDLTSTSLSEPPMYLHFAPNLSRLKLPTNVVHDKETAEIMQGLRHHLGRGCLINFYPRE